MKMNSELNKLKTKDVYSLILFVLYKMKEDVKYSTLSELAYILDKESLLNLCHYYGGITITIPTIEELEDVLNVLLLYQKVDIEGNSIDKILDDFKVRRRNKESMIELYNSVKTILEKYKIIKNVY